MDTRSQVINCLQGDCSFWDEIAAWDIASDEALMILEDMLDDPGITNHDMRFKMSLEHSLEKRKELWASLASQ